jgi:hypothetical protein
MREHVSFFENERRNECLGQSTPPALWASSPNEVHIWRGETAAAALRPRSGQAPSTALTCASRNTPGRCAARVQAGQALSTAQSVLPTSFRGKLLKGKNCLERRKEAGGIKVTFVNFFAERIGDGEARRRRVGAGRRCGMGSMGTPTHANVSTHPPSGSGREGRPKRD